MGIEAAHGPTGSPKREEVDLFSRGHQQFVFHHHVHVTSLYNSD